MIDFAQIVVSIAKQEKVALPESAFSMEPLAHLLYEKEIQLKNLAFQKFWQMQELSGMPDDVIPSPKPREYRTTTKRKAYFHRGKLHLQFAEKKTEESFSFSYLEPKEHRSIYQFLWEKLNQPMYRILGQHLNYAIVRGNYEEFCVILNLHAINANIVRKGKNLAESMQSHNLAILSAFLFYDPSQSSYYREQKRPETQVPFKKLFWPGHYFIDVNDHRFMVAPTAFSQINLSMLPHPVKVRFLKKKITGKSLHEIFSTGQNKDELLILAPPRQGTEPNVIPCIASRNPPCIVHLFCGINEMGKHSIVEKKQVSLGTSHLFGYVSQYNQSGSVGCIETKKNNLLRVGCIETKKNNLLQRKELQ